MHYLSATCNCIFFTPQGLYFHYGLSVCVWVCLSVSEKDFSRTNAQIWMRFMLNCCLLHWPEPFLKEHMFVGFNEFPSLLCWCTVTHHHRPPPLFQRVRLDFTCEQCDVCTYTGPPVSSPIQKD